MLKNLEIHLSVRLNSSGIYSQFYISDLIKIQDDVESWQSVCREPLRAVVQQQNMRAQHQPGHCGVREQ